MKKSTLALTSVLMLSSFSATAITQGEMLANSCFSCHGYDGKSTGSSIPPLGLYPSSLIVSQMKAYRDGTRTGTIMNRHAKGYTDEEIELLAKYIGVQGK